MLQNVFTIHQAKTNLSRLLKKVANGEQVIIARGSVPVAELIPIGPAKRQRQPGLLKGKLLIGPEFFESLPEDELAAGNKKMEVLLDTHALIWWLTDASALPRAAHKVICGA